MAGVAPLNALLETVGLAKAFDGLEAVRAVNFRLERGEIRAIIGPNGAGKTTLVSMISGRIRPTSGKVLFKGRDITRLPAWDRVALGIVYTFQVTSIFKNLTVFENVALAVQRRVMRRPLDRIALPLRALARHVDGVLSDVGLSSASDAPAGSLPYGHQKLLEVAMALALGPEVLTLDEPTQGLAPDEIAALCRLIREISKAVTVLLIEHNMAVVLELSDRVTVMDKGSIIADGTPVEIENHPDVQRSYLGL
ncbi:MAG: ABC transporter ATP-binding protein [Candidatus Rokubacteria bacterium]|nr:ABC transporter ATP-binding protein [Candidatus Rokubacteria bacterium]